MKLICLGTGDAFTLDKDNFQSNFVLISPNNKILMIDCGTDIRYALKDQKINYNDIDGVYVSHFHSDHVGGLEWIGFKRFFSHLHNSNHPLQLYIAPELVAPLWDNVLSGGMRCLEDVQADLSTYFNVMGLKQDLSFEWDGSVIKLVRTYHVKNNDEYLPSYGLELHYRNKVLWLTTDMHLTLDKHEENYKRADLILHDCELSAKASGVHSNYKNLRKLPTEYKNKMWLYHYNLCRLQQVPDVIADDFLGLAKKGQIFDLNSL